MAANIQSIYRFPESIIFLYRHFLTLPLQALQLLEFLVKNGSERVVDDARTHISLLRMLRQFHHIDQNGKDQGLNVRTRAQELAKLLSDVDLIRAERKKARATRHKYLGFSSSTMTGFGNTGRFGGFGSDSLGYGEYNVGVYGDGGGFGGSDFTDSHAFGTPSPRRTNRFEEYDEGDDPNYGLREQSQASSNSTAAASASSASQSKKPAAAPAPLIEDLLDSGNDEPEALTASSVTQLAAAPSGNKAGESSTLNTGNDVGSNKPQAPQSQPAPLLAAPPPPPASASIHVYKPTTTASPGASISSTTSLNLASQTQSQTQPQPQPQVQPQIQQQIQPQPAKTATYQPPTPNYYTSVMATQPQFQPQTSSRNSVSSIGAAKPLNALSSGGIPAATSSSGVASSAASKPASPSQSGDVFGSLWSSASANAGLKPKTTQQTQGPKLSALAKDRTSAGIWNAAAGGSGSAAPKNNMGNDSSSLLG